MRIFDQTNLQNEFRHTLTCKMIDKRANKMCLIKNKCYTF